MSDAESTPQDPPAEMKGRKLRVGEKLMMGTGGVPISLANQLVKANGFFVLTMLLKYSAAWAGVLIAIPRLWDAITDPVMGNFSDNFRSKYGRRRPFILLGAVLMAVTFSLIWMFPADWPKAAVIAWFIVTSLMFYTAFTLFSVPFISMTYEISPDYNERTSVQGYVTFWNRVGEFFYMGLIPLSGILLAWIYGYSDWEALGDSEKMKGIRLSACIYGGIGMFLFGSLPAIFCRERCYEINLKKSRDKKLPFWSTVKDTLGNKSCALLCTLTVCTLFAGVFASSLDWILLAYYMSDGTMVGTQWKMVVSIGYALMGIIGIPFIVYLTKRFTKTQGLKFIYSLMILNSILRWFVFQPGRHYLLWLDPLTGGMFWVGVGVLMQSMIADICDDDELKSGRRREGMFGAMFAWATKAAFAVAYVLCGFYLVLIGFDPALGENQSSGTFLGVRLAMCFGAALSAILCFILLRFYPLTKEKAEENRAKLEELRGKI